MNLFPERDPNFIELDTYLQREGRGEGRGGRGGEGRGEERGGEGRRGEGRIAQIDRQFSSSSLEISKLHVPKFWIQRLKFFSRDLEGSEELAGDGSSILHTSILETSCLDLEETRDDTHSLHGILVLFVQDKLAMTPSLPRPGTTRVCTWQYLLSLHYNAGGRAEGGTCPLGTCQLSLISQNSISPPLKQNISH